MPKILNIVLAAGMAFSTTVVGRATALSGNPSDATQDATQPTLPAPDKSTSPPTTGKSQNANPEAPGATVTPRKKRRAAPTNSAAAPSDTPKKIIVRQGGVREPSAQIVTDMDPAEATRKREESEKLLSAADESLKRLADRSLSEQQQETVSQIDHYMTVARSALKEGDISRGHTLALKANLLALDLAKQERGQH